MSRRALSYPHRIFLAGGCLAVGLVTACSSSGGTSSSSSPISIASMGALTGPNAVYGINSLDGEKLAAKEINAAGGVDGRKITITQYDDQCEPTQAAVVASKIISGGSFTGVVGPVCSADVLASLPVFARTKIPVIAAGDSAPQITTLIHDKGYDFASRLSPQDAQNGPALAKLAVSVLGKKKVALLYSNDDYGQGLLTSVKSTLTGLGASIVASESYTPSTTKDFTPQLTHIASSGADALLLLGYYSDTGIAVSQLARAGVSPSVTVIGSDSTAQDGFLPLAGSAANGAYLVPFYAPEGTTAVNQKFVAAYEKAYGSAPTGNSVCGYEAVYAFANAIKAGGSDSDLAAQIRAVNFEGPGGAVAFDTNGDLKGSPATVLHVVNGKFADDSQLTSSLQKAIAQ
jgi:branched-chain amino acid transport system substrate-binding protein